MNQFIDRYKKTRNEEINEMLNFKWTSLVELTGKLISHDIRLIENPV